MAHRATIEFIAFDYGKKRGRTLATVSNSPPKRRPRRHVLSVARLSYSSSTPKTLPVVGFTRWVRWQARQVIAL